MFTDRFFHHSERLGTTAQTVSLRTVPRDSFQGLTASFHAKRTFAPTCPKTMIRILLIDHSLGHESSVRGLLGDGEASDFKVDCVSTYREILHAFRSDAYDVCLIDSLMDNGLKLFAQARGLSFTAPVVLVIANSANTVVQAMRSGVSDCLVRDQLDMFQIERSVCYVVEQARNMSLKSQRERRHLALLDNAREIVYTHDLDGRFTSINRVGEKLIGYSESEIRAMRVGQIVVPEYRELLTRVIEQTLDAQTQVVEKIELLRKNGSTLEVEINTHPIQHNGRTIEVQVIARTSQFHNHAETTERQCLIEDGYVFHPMPDFAGAISHPSFAQ
jgi:PAS domain S-box-containing protein